jgi:hypothetical protein
VGVVTHTMPDPVHPLPRRRRRLLLPALALALGLALPELAGVIPGAAGPFGAAADAEAVPAGTAGVTRYFGRGAYDGIRAAVAAVPRACELSDDELTALVMAPVFKEVSQAQTPDAAPSPMTLSRWDEWTGVAAGNNNMNANYGLYPFRDPYGTPYPRAYWTPGIGIFQYDSAGVGAPFTAAELIDVKYVAGDVAAGMAGRYCAADGDGYARRAAAWEPWQALGGIAKSEALYQEMMGTDAPAFSRIGLVDGIEDGGGMVARTCQAGGQQVECWYVNPGWAQGANWWATADPSGGAPGSGQAPLTAPFYIIKRDGYEERHWLAPDTGYPVNLRARRLLGANARPRDGQPESGLEWFEWSDLCDTARAETGCPPLPAAPEPAAATGDVAPGDAAPVPEPTVPATPMLPQLNAALRFAAPLPALPAPAAAAG